MDPDVSVSGKLNVHKEAPNSLHLEGEEEAPEDEVADYTESAVNSTNSSSEGDKQRRSSKKEASTKKESTEKDRGKPKEAKDKDEPRKKKEGDRSKPKTGSK